MPAAAKKTAAPAATSTVNVGDKAPAFSLPADSGEVISLSGLKGKNVVLYFYPKDDTSGCTIEAKDFRDLSAAFGKANTVVLGVSKDSLKSHCKFRDKYELNFNLLSDEEGKACEAYGTWVEKSMYGKKYMGIQRATFLIDAAGKIAKIWPKVSVTGHAAEVLKEAQKLA